MDITKLNRLQISTLANRQLEISDDEFKNLVNSLLEYYKLAERGDVIPQGVYDFIMSKEFPAFMKKNQKDKVICQYSGGFYQKDDPKLVKIYKSYEDFKAGNNCFIYVDFISATIEDEILGVRFLDRSMEIFDDNFETKKIANSHGVHLINNGTLFESQVARRKRIYSTKRTNFFGHGNSPKDWAIPDGDTIGIEIEMLFESLQKKLQFSSWLGENFAGWHCEYDGSLEDHGNAGDCGLELISPPLLFEDICSQATIICEKAVELGGKGFFPGGIFYGMHVTNQVPKARGKITRALIASRYIVLMNDSRLRPFWQLVARRKGESFSTYCPFKDVNLETCLRTEVGDGGRDAHRRAVFVRNPSLLETRIFRSNLAPISVRANIEICYLTMQFCKSDEFSLDNLRNFYDYIHNNMSKDLKACLYRKKNSPIRALNEIVTESEIENASKEGEVVY